MNDINKYKNRIMKYENKIPVKTLFEKKIMFYVAAHQNVNLLFIVFWLCLLCSDVINFYMENLNTYFVLISRNIVTDELHMTFKLKNLTFVKRLLFLHYTLFLDYGNIV